MIGITKLEEGRHFVKPRRRNDPVNAKNPRSESDRGFQLETRRKSVALSQHTLVYGRSAKLDVALPPAPESTYWRADSARPTTSVASTPEAPKSATA